MSSAVLDDSAGVSDSGNDFRNLNFKVDLILHKLEEQTNVLQDKLDAAIVDIKNELSSTVSELRRWHPDGASALNNNIDDSLSKVRGVFNKLTPENFDVHLKTMVTISLDTNEIIQQVISLIFEKITSEHYLTPMYVKFCKVLFEEVKPESKRLFHTSLTRRVQTEYETNVNNGDAKKKQLKPLLDKLETSTDAKERIEIQYEIIDQENQFRQRALGTVRLMVEMYKIKLMTGDRVMLCIESLLEHGSEEKLEYICILLTTVGHLLEQSMDKRTEQRLDRIFNRISVIIKESAGSDKMRFMMQDVISLRGWVQNPSNAAAAPFIEGGSVDGGEGSSKSKHQNRRRNQHVKNNRNNFERGDSPQRNGSGGYASNNQRRRRGQGNRYGYYNNNLQKSNNQTPSNAAPATVREGGYVDGVEGSSKSKHQRRRRNQHVKNNRNNFGGQGNRYGYYNKNVQKSNNQAQDQSLDLKKLNSSQSVDSTEQLQLPTNPCQVLSTRESDNDHHQNSDASHASVSCSSNEGSGDDETSAVNYTTKDVRKMINGLVEDFMDCVRNNSNTWQNEALNTCRTYTLRKRVELVHCLLMDYLHLGYLGKDQRSATAMIFSFFLRTKVFEKNTFVRAYDQFAEEFPDVLIDVPNGWTYVFEFLGPLLHEHLLTFDDIWRSDWKDDRHFTQCFVKAFIAHFTKEYGANYIRDMWHKDFKLDKGQLFMSDQEEWNDFISSNKMQLIYNANVKPPSDFTSCNSSTVEQKVKRLETLLKGGNNLHLATDYINTNVNINEEFIRKFARFLCCDYAIEMIPSSSSSSTMKTDSANNTTKIPQLNADIFCLNCVPLLRLCLEAQESYKLVCLDAVYDAIQVYSDYPEVIDLTLNILDLLNKFM